MTPVDLFCVPKQAVVGIHIPSIPWEGCFCSKVMFVAQMSSSAASTSAWDLNYCFSWFRETWSHESITKYSILRTKYSAVVAWVLPCPLFLLAFIAHRSGFLGSCLEEMNCLGSERCFQFCPKAVTESDHASGIVIRDSSPSVPEEPHSNQQQC